MRFPGRHHPTPFLREMLLGMVLLAAALAPAAARAAPALPAGAPVLLVDDPSALAAALEARGFSLAAVLGATGDDSTAALAAASPAFRTLAETAVADIAELRAEMAGKGIRLYEVTDGNVGRVLDGRWLASPIARFRLVGVVDRLDRAGLRRRRGARRELRRGVRLVYRLAYRFTRGDTVYSSRLAGGAQRRAGGAGRRLRGARRRLRARHGGRRRRGRRRMAGGRPASLRRASP